VSGPVPGPGPCGRPGTIGPVPSLSDRSPGVGSDGRWTRRLRWAHLVPEALGLSLRYRVGRRTRRLSPAIVESDPPSAPGVRPPVSYVVAAVRLATAIRPFRTTCLVRSMVLARMLRRRGYPAQVVVGIPGDGVGRDPRFAHAWVEVGRTARSPGYSALVRLVP
jgi:hypothetical protein